MEKTEKRTSPPTSSSILQFIEEQTNLKQSSRKQYKSTLGKIFRVMGTSPESCTKQDVLRYFHSKGFQKYTISYQNFVKIVLRKFLTWLGKESPYIKQIKQVEEKLDSEEILTKEQINTLLRHMDQKEQAMIMVLLEGLRVSEMTNLKIKDFSAEGECGSLYVSESKSCKRPVPLVRATPFLIKYLTNHPVRDDPEAWIFCHIWKGEWIKYTGEGIWNILQKYDHLVKPHLHPHLFRHCSATYDSRAKMPDSFILLKHGWKSRRMLDRYSHLAGNDVKSKYFEVYGIKEPEEREDPKNLVDSVLCHRCRTQNLTSNKYCTKCGALLDVERLHEITQTTESLSSKYTKTELFEMFQLFLDKIDSKQGKK